MIWIATAKKEKIKITIKPINIKDEDKLNQFEGNLIKTSKISGFLKDKKDITNIKSFINGDWWVQDFSSFLPIYNFKVKDISIKDTTLEDLFKEIIR